MVMASCSLNFLWVHMGPTTGRPDTLENTASVTIIRLLLLWNDPPASSAKI